MSCNVRYKVYCSKICWNLPINATSRFPSIRDQLLIVRDLRFWDDFKEESEGKKSKGAIGDVF